MENVISKQCEHPLCTIRPSYGFECGKATHCLKHLLEGMEDVISKQCEHPLCNTCPSYGFERGKPTHCLKHLLEGMEDVINKRCDHPLCKKKPTFGHEWGKPTHCGDHSDDGMEDVVHDKCEHGRRLEYCLGDACGKKIAGHSEEELFTNAAAWIAWGESPDAVADFLKALDVRLYYDDGEQRRLLKPDLCLKDKKLIHEHDGALYHMDAQENDLRKNKAYTSLGFSVYRTRVGDIGAVEGSMDVFVSRTASRDDMARATFCKICAVSEEMCQTVWRSIDSLVKRALIEAQNDGQQFIDAMMM
jgi:EsV-1-7 cysteine-rich motif